MQRITNWSSSCNASSGTQSLSDHRELLYHHTPNSSLIGNGFQCPHILARYILEYRMRIKFRGLNFRDLTERKVCKCIKFRG